MGKYSELRQEHPAELRGDPELPGLILELRSIWWTQGGAGRGQIGTLRRLPRPGRRWADERLDSRPTVRSV